MSETARPVFHARMSAFYEKLGYYAALYILYRIVAYVGGYLLRRRDALSKFKGEWAVISGASYGLGRCIAERIAAKGLNVVLIARSKASLDAIAEDIQRTYKVRAVVLAYDFIADGVPAAGADAKITYLSKDGEDRRKAAGSEFFRFEKENPLRVLADGMRAYGIDPHRDVAVLVNNVGGGNVPGSSSMMHSFVDWSEHDTHYLKKLNGDSTYNSIKLFLPGMVKKNRGIVVNVASLSTEYPAYLYPYSTEKSKVVALTRMLEQELYFTNIRVRCFLPAGIATPGLQQASGKEVHAGFFTPSAESVADSIVGQLGPGAVIVNSHAIHIFQHMWVQMLPEWVQSPVRGLPNLYLHKQTQDKHIDQKKE
ncbi:hypothetical protein BJ742DRAFT_856996 [Cladochytrium replicatum]|nr:hypothetical protein BJ742DRAFT_856996 [Cladochytrium replicatum]